MSVPGREAMREHVLTGVEYHAALVLDERREGEWPTYRRCLEATPSDATHHLILQDDLDLCANFPAVARAAVKANPEVPISFFGTRRYILEARQRGVSWVRCKSPLMSQAYCWPVGMIPDMLDWIAAHVYGLSLNLDDSFMAAYLLSKGLFMWYTAPSLVEHVGYDKSTIGIRGVIGGIPRTAKWFEPEPGDIDWTAGLTNPVIDSSGSLRNYAQYIF